MSDDPEAGWPHGDGEMAKRTRAFGWAQTTLGARDGWPQSLRSALETMLAMPDPATLLWGPDHVQIYNDAYVGIARDRHPALLGRPVAEGWPDAYPEVIAPLLTEVDEGRSVKLTGITVPLRNSGDEIEDRVFDTSWSPLRDEGGKVAGALQTLVEVTAGHRLRAALQATQARQTFLLGLSDALRPLRDPSGIEGTACRLLADELGVERAYYVAIDEASGKATVRRDHVRGNAPSIRGEHPVSNFSWVVEILREGRDHVVDDARTSFIVPERDRASLAALQIVSCVRVPLIRDGRLVGALCVTASSPRDWRESEVDLLRDVGDRVWVAIEWAMAEATLRERETLFRGFVTASSDVVYRMSADWSEMRRLDGRGFLTNTSAPTTGWQAHYIHEEDWPRIEETIRHAIRTRGVFELEHRVRRADGSLGWTLSRAVPILDQAGEITEWLGSAKDVTHVRRTQERLRESEARFAQFAASSSDALWIRDAETLSMEYVSPAIERIYGIGPDDILGDVTRWTDLIAPDDREVARAHIEQARSGLSVTHEFRIRRPSDGALRWIRNTDFPLRDPDGRIQRVGGIAEDVTAAKLAADRQSVMVAELQHRTRNLIAVVRGIAGDTMRETGPTGTFRELFNDRLSALSRVQGLLSRSEVAPITIGALVRLELDALGGGTLGKRLVVDGPEVYLKPFTVQTLALALHELATNARKYGALSHEAGHLDVTWRERPEGAGRRLTLEWVESGLERVPGRPSRPTESGGYGRELIEHALPHTLDAETTYAITASGVRCTIDMPVRSGPGRDEA